MHMRMYRKRLEGPEREGPEHFEKKCQNVPGAVGASAAPALSNIPFIGWVAAGFVTMFGADKGGDIGADLSTSYAGCDDVDVPHTK